VHRFTNKEKDYRLHTKTKRTQEHRKLLILYSPHNLVVSVIIQVRRRREKGKDCAGYYFEKLINNICFLFWNGTK
jgi:hypothetical protein